MDPHELARRTREEHEKVQELCERLRRTMAAIPARQREEWLTDLRDRFEHLRAHMVKRMALEEKEEGGYLGSVVAIRPAMAEQVDRLRHVHDELRRLLDVLHRQVEVLGAKDDLLLQDTASRVNDLLGYIHEHHEKETLMVTLAMTEDIGTKD
jgi:hemerythrin-like domain-containing protein